MQKHKNLVEKTYPNRESSKELEISTKTHGSKLQMQRFRTPKRSTSRSLQAFGEKSGFCKIALNPLGSLSLNPEIGEGNEDFPFRKPYILLTFHT